MDDYCYDDFVKQGYVLNDTRDSTELFFCLAVPLPTGMSRIFDACLNLVIFTLTMARAIHDTFWSETQFESEHLFTLHCTH